MAGRQDGHDDGNPIDASHARGMQVGDHNTQHNHFYDKPPDARLEIDLIEVYVTPDRGKLSNWHGIGNDGNPDYLLVSESYTKVLELLRETARALLPQMRWWQKLSDVGNCRRLAVQTSRTEWLTIGHNIAELTRGWQQTANRGSVTGPPVVPTAASARHYAKQAEVVMSQIRALRKACG